MNMENLLGEELSGSIKKVRIKNDDYEELVFFAKHGINLQNLLTEKLGPVIKGEKPNASPFEKEIIEKAIGIANSNGGIDDDQFLYGGIVESFKIVIMIWPWQDNEHLTIKKFIVT